LSSLQEVSESTTTAFLPFRHTKELTMSFVPSWIIRFRQRDSIGRLVLAGTIGLLATACGSPPPPDEPTAASQSNLSWSCPPGTHSELRHDPPYGVLICVKDAAGASSTDEQGFIDSANETANNDAQTNGDDDDDGEKVASDDSNGDDNRVASDDGSSRDDEVASNDCSDDDCSGDGTSNTASIKPNLR
jgi:hypothetical protein